MEAIKVQDLQVGDYVNLDPNDQILGLCAEGECGDCDSTRIHLAALERLHRTRDDSDGEQDAVAGGSGSGGKGISAMGKAPKVCIYCDGEGNSRAGGSCGFCMGGKPLDTQEDWDRSWGKTLEQEGVKPMVDEVLRKRAEGTGSNGAH